MLFRSPWMTCPTMRAMTTMTAPTARQAARWMLWSTASAILPCKQEHQRRAKALLFCCCEKGILSCNTDRFRTCHCEEQSDVAISWYHVSFCTAKTNIVPGDCHVGRSAFALLAMTYSELLSVTRKYTFLHIMYLYGNSPCPIWTGAIVVLPEICSALLCEMSSTRKETEKYIKKQGISPGKCRNIH